jgi:serine/threonine protein kinase
MEHSGFTPGYRKQSLLGEGSFGTVYRAVRSGGASEVAIKRYNLRKTADVHYQTLRELNILKMTDHPNIIKLYEIVVRKNQIDAVMEYGGDNLDDYIKVASSEFRLEQFKHVMFQIAAGCEYLHRMGIIHRDLKPTNILVSLKYGKEINIPKIKICDFGISKCLPPFDSCANSYQICTLPYRPPELFASGNEVYSSSVDVWSLGCLLYELITGSILFAGRSEITVLCNILSRVPTTEQTLQLLKLNCMELKHCNTEAYHKLPQLYDPCSQSPTKEMLTEFQGLVQKMLVLDPTKRICMSAILADKFLNEVRTAYPNIDSRTNSSHIKHKNFHIRPELKMWELRNLNVIAMISMGQARNVHSQTIFVAVNLFDQYLAKKQSAPDLPKYMRPIGNCCLVLASKYIDITHLHLVDFVDVEWTGIALVKLEKEVLETVNFDLIQLTLPDLHRELIEEGVLMQTSISRQHIAVYLEIISDYGKLINKDIQELKELVLQVIYAEETRKS